MGLREELERDVSKIFRDSWSTRDGYVVPESEDLKLGNDAVKLSATVLYADMTASTKLVDGQSAAFAAEVYKAFLYCAAKIIRAEDGVITAYDGDRIMGVFVGDSKNTSAARAALKINFARVEVINPALKAVYTSSDYEVRHTVGIDTSDLFVARTGIRGSNDLVWVGRAANYAAKLTDLPPEWQTRVTGDVYDAMNASMKTWEGRAVWEERTWTDMNGMRIYRSAWRWQL